MKKLQKNIFLSGLFLLLTLLQNTAFAKIEAILGSSLDKNSGLVLEPPQTSAPEIILSRDQYVLSYNKVKRSANWVSWKLETDRLGTSGRSNNFAIDTELQDYLSKDESNKPAVDITEYKGSCYDRGHQIPSADRTDSLPNNEATFLMSNMIPQTAYMNRIIWEHLEEYSRKLVKDQGKKLYVIAGPIYDDNLGSIGPEKDIPVPSKNFKIVFVLNADQSYKEINSNTETIAVVMPNILQDGSSPKTNPEGLCKTVSIKNEDKADWEKYKSTVADIEKLSGLTFSYLQNKLNAINE